MPTTDTNPAMVDLVETVTRRFGPDRARLFMEVFSDSDVRARLQDLVSPQPMSDLGQAFQTLSAFATTGLGSGSNVGTAMRTVLAAFHDPLRFRLIPPDAVPSRPPEKGFPEALKAMIDAVESGLGQLQEKHAFDVERAKLLLMLIVVYRELGSAVVGFLTVLMRNLALTETEAHKMMDTAYKLVRQMALADPRWNDVLKIVEDYFYEPSRQAVKTRREHERQKEEVQKEATKAAMAEASKKVRDTLADELAILLQDFLRTNPNDPRVNPR
jgi:hypothetical protein